MMTTFKSMGQSVQSLGNKAVAHPHWAGKIGYATLAVTLVGLCGIAVVIWAGLYVPVHMLAAMLRNSGKPQNRTGQVQYDTVPDVRHHMYELDDPRSWTEYEDSQA